MILPVTPNSISHVDMVSFGCVAKRIKRNRWYRHNRSLREQTIPRTSHPMGRRSSERIHHSVALFAYISNGGIEVEQDICSLNTLGSKYSKKMTTFPKPKPKKVNQNIIKTILHKDALCIGNLVGRLKGCFTLTGYWSSGFCPSLQ